VLPFGEMSAKSATDDPTDVQPQVELRLTAQRRAVSVCWTDASGAGGRFRLESRALVGSAESVPVRIQDRAVSRIHAELDPQRDGVWVRDLGSRNGTWVGGVLVKHARIPDDGRVQIGSSTLWLAFEDEASDVALWPNDRFGPLLARSDAMRELFIRLAQYAASDAPVLIQGETGTGKELVAEAIHQSSPRGGEPLVVVDCAAMPESLLDSELFGFTKGAFTGAVAPRAGAFEAADGGTVFLDEIGELPLAMQPKLLRVLESKMVRRIGENKHRAVDVRFIVATHRDLQSMVASGAFREDLYFRISVLPAYVPPLRARTEDIGLLLSHFMTKAPALHVDPDVVQTLEKQAWAGNVRELRTFAERAMTVGVRAALAMTLDLAPPPVPSRVPLPTAMPTFGPNLTTESPSVRVDVPFKVLREQWVDYLEREYMRELITQHGRSVGTLADEAGLDRSYVHRLLRKHEL